MFNGPLLWIAGPPFHSFLAMASQICILVDCVLLCEFVRKPHDMYISLVRPIMVYGYIIWDPYTCSTINKLETNIKIWPQGLLLVYIQGIVDESLICLNK